MINNIIKVILFCVFALIIILTVLAINIYEQQPMKPTSNETVVLRMAESMPKNHPSAEASREFAKNVSEETDGNVRIEIHYKSELGNSSQAIEQLQFGGIAFAKVNILDLINKYKQLEDILKVNDPPNRDIAYAEFKNELEKAAKILEIENIRILAIYYPEIRVFASNVHPLQKNDGFKDMKIAIQTSVILERLITDLGARPITLLPGSEVKAINDGYLQGIEMPLVEYEKDGYSSILPFVTINNSIYCSEVLLVSDLVFAKIALNERKIIFESAQKNIEFHDSTIRKAEEEILMKLQIQSLIID